MGTGCRGTPTTSISAATAIGNKKFTKGSSTNTGFLFFSTKAITNVTGYVHTDQASR